MPGCGGCFATDKSLKDAKDEPKDSRNQEADTKDDNKMYHK